MARAENITSVGGSSGAKDASSDTSWPRAVDGGSLRPILAWSVTSAGESSSASYDASVLVVDAWVAVPSAAGLPRRMARSGSCGPVEDPIAADVRPRLGLGMCFSSSARACGERRHRWRTLRSDIRQVEVPSSSSAAGSPRAVTSVGDSSGASCIPSMRRRRASPHVLGARDDCRGALRALTIGSACTPSTGARRSPSPETMVRGITSAAVERSGATWSLVAQDAKGPRSAAGPPLRIRAPSCP